jgi:hypothetical protein
LNSGRLPSSDGLELRKDLVETAAKIFDNVVTVQARPVTCVERRSGAADQDGARHERLEVALRSEKSFPIG